MLGKSRCSKCSRQARQRRSAVQAVSPNRESGGEEMGGIRGVADHTAHRDPGLARHAGGAPHPGAQLRITDHNGNRVTGFASITRPGGPGAQIAELELRHPRRARCEDRIRAARTPIAEPQMARIRPEPHLVPARPSLCELLAWSQMLGYRRPPRPTLGTQNGSGYDCSQPPAGSPVMPPPRAAPRRRSSLDRAIARRPDRDHRPAGPTRLTHHLGLHPSTWNPDRPVDPATPPEQRPSCRTPRALSAPDNGHRAAKQSPTPSLRDEMVSSDRLAVRANLLPTVKQGSRFPWVHAIEVHSCSALALPMGPWPHWGAAQARYDAHHRRRHQDHFTGPIPVAPGSSVRDFRLSTVLLFIGVEPGLAAENLEHRPVFQRPASHRRRQWCEIVCTVRRWRWVVLPVAASILFPCLGRRRSVREALFFHEHAFHGFVGHQLLKAVQLGPLQWPAHALRPKVGDL